MKSVQSDLVRISLSFCQDHGKSQRNQKRDETALDHRSGGAIGAAAPTIVRDIIGLSGDFEHGPGLRTANVVIVDQKEVGGTAPVG